MTTCSCCKNPLSNNARKVYRVSYSRETFITVRLDMSNHKQLFSHITTIESPYDVQRRQYLKKVYLTKGPKCDI